MHKTQPGSGRVFYWPAGLLIGDWREHAAVMNAAVWRGLQGVRIGLHVQAHGNIYHNMI